MSKVHVRIKGIVNVISGDPPFIEGHAWFTAIPLKPDLSNNEEDIWSGKVLELSIELNWVP